MGREKKGGGTNCVMCGRREIEQGTGDTSTDQSVLYPGRIKSLAVPFLLMRCVLAYEIIEFLRHSDFRLHLL